MSVHSEAEEEEQAAAAVVFVSTEEFEEQIQEVAGQQTEDAAQQPCRHRGAGETRGRSLNHDVITLPVSFLCRLLPTSD